MFSSPHTHIYTNIYLYTCIRAYVHAYLNAERLAGWFLSVGGCLCARRATRFNGSIHGPSLSLLARGGGVFV